MSDPSRLYDNLPPAYDKNPQRDLYKILSGLAKGIDDLDTFLQDFRADLTVVNADGQGMDIVAENYGIARPPGMEDGRLGLLVRALLPAKRGTLQAIRNVLQVATGISSVTIEDKQVNAFIPEYHIFITISPGTNPSQGRGFYPEMPAAGTPGFPEESSISGTILDETGYWGGQYNDHYWSPVDYWTQQILNEVKLAGTVLVFFES